MKELNANTGKIANTEMIYLAIVGIVMILRSNMIKLYHWTEKKNLESIMKHGLNLNKIGKPKQFFYLTKFPDKWKDLHTKTGRVLLEVIVPSGIRLSCFEEYADGAEVLCWGNIPANKIKMIE